MDFQLEQVAVWQSGSIETVGHMSSGARSLKLDRSSTLIVIQLNINTRLTRLGWFMPNWTLAEHPSVEHWRALTEPHTASIFHVDTTEMERLSPLSRRPDGRYDPLT